MAAITTSTFIARSPEAVKAIFMDFDTWSTWHQGFFKSVKPLPSTTSPSESSDPYAVGKMLDVKLDGFEVQPEIVTNDPASFSWKGEGFGLKGVHYFRFTPATEGGVEGTRFEHGENFSGTTSFLFGDGFVANLIGIKAKSAKGFAAFNEDLKKKCESAA